MATDQSLYFPSILIEGFKAIDDLKIDSLAPMNLLTGDNNCLLYTSPSPRDA